MVDAILYMFVCGTVASVGYVMYMEPVVFVLGAIAGIILYFVRWITGKL